MLFMACTASEAQEVIQMTSGWCSPTIANVVGNVSIKCVGISPAVHRQLNEDLQRVQAKHKLQVQELIAKAEMWVARYKQLKQHVDEQPASSTAVEEVNQLIRAGNLRQAAERLDRGISKENEQHALFARLHYLRGSLFALAFDYDKAAEHLQRAYQYQSDNADFARAYANLLLEQNRVGDADRVVGATLPKLRVRANDGSPRDVFALVSILDTESRIAAQNSEADRLARIADEAMVTLAKVAKLHNFTETYGDAVGALMFVLGSSNLYAGNLEKAERLLELTYIFYFASCMTDENKCVVAAGAMSLAAYANTKQKNHSKALERLQKARQVYEMAGDRHPALRGSIALSSALSHIALGELDQAVKELQASLTSWREGQPLSHRHRAVLVQANNELGEIAKSRGQFGEAESYYKKAIAIAEGGTR